MVASTIATDLITSDQWVGSVYSADKERVDSVLGWDRGGWYEIASKNSTVSNL